MIAEGHSCQCLTVKDILSQTFQHFTGLSLLFLQVALLYGADSSPQSTVG